MTTAPRRRDSVLRIVAATAVAAVGVLPVFLAGATGVLLRPDLSLSTVQFGFAISMFWVAAAVAAVPAGRTLHRLSGGLSMSIGAITAAVSLFGIATAGSVTWLTVALVIGGVGSAFSQLAAAQFIADGVIMEHQGLAFGVKQSAIPAATLIGGIAVPVALGVIGWRGAFVAAGVFSLVLAIVTARGARAFGVSAPRAPQSGRARFARLPLIAVGAIAGLATASSTAMAAFVVEYSATETSSVALAGVVLAVGSASAIVSRVWLGARAGVLVWDRLHVIAAMIGVGGLAIVVLPFAHGWLLVPVVTLAYAIGWGWPGLMIYTIVHHHRHAPAAATGFAQSGIWIGAAVGPLTFGALVNLAGFDVAWMVAGAAMVVAGGVLVALQPNIRRSWE